MKNPARMGRIALLTAAVIWGSSFIIMKDAVKDVPVFLLLAVRFTIAGVLLAVVFHHRLKTAGYSILGSGALCGVMLLAAYATQTFGLVETTAGKNAFLTAVYCVLVPFLSWVAYHKRPTACNWVAAALCLTGVGLVSLDGKLTMGAGNLLTLLGGVFFALHIMVLTSGSRKHDPIALTTVQFAVTAGLAWLLHFLTESVARPSIPATAWPQLLYLSVFATAVTLVLQSVGQRLTPPNQSAILLSLESVLGVAFSVLLGAEALSLQLMLGFLLIFISVIVSETQLSFLRKKA